jgi:hypothetical protein
MRSRGVALTTRQRRRSSNLERTLRTAMEWLLKYRRAKLLTEELAMMI